MFPGCNLMAFITPTTTMMREGIMQSSTKVDSGWAGTLNWGLRNSSIRDFILGYGEPIFKLTFFLLEGDEIPAIHMANAPMISIKTPTASCAQRDQYPQHLEKEIVSSSSERADRETTSRSRISIRSHWSRTVRPAGESGKSSPMMSFW